MCRALDDRGEELLGKLRADTDERVGLLNYFLLVVLTLFKLHFFGSHTNEPFNFVVRHAVVLNELLANVAYLRGGKVCVNAVYVNGAGGIGSAVATQTMTFTAPASLAIMVYVNVNGTWKQASPWVNIGGTWKQVAPYINNAGTWK